MYIKDGILQARELQLSNILTEKHKTSVIVNLYENRDFFPAGALVLSYCIVAVLPGVYLMATAKGRKGFKDTDKEGRDIGAEYAKVRNAVETRLQKSIEKKLARQRAHWGT